MIPNLMVSSYVSVCEPVLWLRGSRIHFSYGIRAVLVPSLLLTCLSLSRPLIPSRSLVLGHAASTAVFNEDAANSSNAEGK